MKFLFHVLLAVAVIALVKHVFETVYGEDCCSFLRIK